MENAKWSHPKSVSTEIPKSPSEQAIMYRPLYSQPRCDI
jgi:hypothetical protein